MSLEEEAERAGKSSLIVRSAMCYFLEKRCFTD